MGDIEKQIVAVLEKIRPFIQRDGGDVMFHHYEDGICYITMLGACVDCTSQDSTVSQGIEIILSEEVPSVVKVVVLPSTSSEENTDQQK